MEREGTSGEGGVGGGRTSGEGGQGEGERVGKKDKGRGRQDKRRGVEREGTSCEKMKE